MTDSLDSAIPPILTALPDEPGFLILRQFLMDLSVECPAGRLPEEKLPEIQQKHRIRIETAALEPADQYLVDIGVGLAAGVGDDVVFLAELTYRVEVKLHKVPEEEVDEVLCARLPDALQQVLGGILEYNGRLAGYPEMRVGDLDFIGVFAQREVVV